MAEPLCGLIAAVPPHLQADWAAALPDLLKRFRPAALVLLPPFDAAAAILAAAKPLEVAILLHGDIDRAASAGADGVYLAGGPEQIKAARTALGSAAIIGAACALNRHDPMENAEAGADFVAFEARVEAAFQQAAELSRWWSEMTQIPTAIACAFTCPFPAAFLHSARPDFLLVEESGGAAESLTFAIELGLHSEM